jgi:hypothetical protein
VEKGASLINDKYFQRAWGNIMKNYYFEMKVTRQLWLELSIIFENKLEISYLFFHE